MDYIIPIIIALVVVVIVIISVLVYLNNKDDNGGYQSHEQHIFQNTPRNEVAGKLGEEYVNENLIPLLREDECLLTNLLIPVGKDFKTEVDCVLITRKGIFCIEIKNWMGVIVGDDYDEEWSQKPSTYEPIKHHKNPVMQNEKHCEAIERVLKNKYDVYNIVIFKSLGLGSDVCSNYTFSIDQFYDYYNEIVDDKLHLDELVDIYNKLEKYVASEEELDEHKRYLQEKYQNQEHYY